MGLAQEATHVTWVPLDLGTHRSHLSMGVRPQLHPGYDDRDMGTTAPGQWVSHASAVFPTNQAVAHTTQGLRAVIMCHSDHLL